jgi:putative addiction module CopG family antidote
MPTMNVAIPPEFVAFAKEQVEAGAFASEEEVVAAALREHVARLDGLRALIDEGLDSGKPLDGETFLRELLEETRKLAARRRA